MHELDATDIKILNLLQTDPRISVSQLATKVFKRPQTVHDRLHKLRDEGYILRHLTLLDRKKIGIPALVVTLIKLEKQNRDTLLAFEAALCAMPQIQLCIHLSGKWDFILHVAARNQQDYYDWLMQELFSLPHIEHVESSFALKEAKAYGAFAL